MRQYGHAPQDYMTSVIGNKTIAWLNATLGRGAPVFAYIAPHAPHVPATVA
jgi:N-acetylglucosamine-6-sulfatase